MPTMGGTAAAGSPIYTIAAPGVGHTVPLPTATTTGPPPPARLQFTLANCGVTATGI
jgi:hypothetical protein